MQRPDKPLSPSPGVIPDGFDYAAVLYRQKWIVVAILIVFLAIAVVVRFTMTRPYDVAIITVPASSGDTSSTGTSLVGTLVSLGIMSQVGSQDEKAVTLATLESRSFLQSFIADNNLMPALFPSLWDETSKAWKADVKPPKLEDGYKMLHGIMRVDRGTTDNIVTLHVKWPDAQFAAYIANALVAKLNGTFQSNAIESTGKMISYLNDAYNQTAIEAVRVSIANLIEEQIKQRMMAKSRDQFALTVVDPAQPNEDPVGPGLLVLGASAGLLGLLIGVPTACLYDRIREAKHSAKRDDV